MFIATRGTPSLLHNVLKVGRKKRAEGDPAALQLTDVSHENFVGEEAPVARPGPRSPDAFYRGEEAGAALKSPADNN